MHRRENSFAKAGTFQNALHDPGLHARIIIVVVFALEGVGAAEHGEKHDAHAPDVRQLGVVLPRRQHLGSCKERGVKLSTGTSRMLGAAL